MASEALASSDNLDLTPEARVALGRVYALLLSLAAEADDTEDNPADDHAAEVSREGEGVPNDSA